MDFAPEYASSNGKCLKVKVRTGMSNGALLAKVCAEAGITVAEAKGDRRIRRIAWPRQQVMWTLREVYGWTYPAIGRLLGGRDHTTALHGVKRHAARVEGRGE